MPTAPGYATCAYELRHSTMSRSAFITFGVDPTDTDPNTVANKLQLQFATAGSLFSVIDSSVTMVKVRVSMGTDGSEDLVGENTTPVACTKTVNSSPPNVAALVHKRTARGGRRGRGRMYIPWVVDASATSENGALFGTNRTAIANAVDVWRLAVTSNVGIPVLLHRPSKPGTAHPTTPGPPNDIVSWYVDPLVATQRRRLGR